MVSPDSKSSFLECSKKGSEYTANGLKVREHRAPAVTSFYSCSSLAVRQNASWSRSERALKKDPLLPRFVAGGSALPLGWPSLCVFVLCASFASRMILRDKGWDILCFVFFLLQPFTHPNNRSAHNFDRLLQNT